MKQIVVGIIERSMNRQKKYLLISSQKDFGKYTGFYYPPGGHIEKGEGEIIALKREVKEEVGLEIISAKKIASTPGDISNQLTHWYSCKMASYDIKINCDEINDAGYFSKDEILSMQIWPATLNFFKKYIFKVSENYPAS